MSPASASASAPAAPRFDPSRPDAAALEAAVAATVADVLQGAPGALAETKQLLAALGPVASEAYAEAGAQAFARRAASPEAAEGIASFKERRKASWALT